MIQFDELIFQMGRFNHQLEMPGSSEWPFWWVLFVTFSRVKTWPRFGWSKKGSLGRSWWLVGYQQISNTNTRCFKHFSEILCRFSKDVEEKHVSAQMFCKKFGGDWWLKEPTLPLWHDIHLAPFGRVQEFFSIHLKKTLDFLVLFWILTTFCNNKFISNGVKQFTELFHLLEGCFFLRGETITTNAIMIAISRVQFNSWTSL